MNCQRCNSERVCNAGGKCSDMFNAQIGNNNIEGYVPADLGIGNGDYIEINYCLDCGQLQGKFPLEQSAMEKEVSDQEVKEFFENHFCEGDYVPSNFVRQHELLKYSKEYSLKLESFLRDFFQSNKNKRMPSSIQFVEMFRSNNYYL